MRAGFGLPDLDERLEGGLDRGTVVLLSGPAGMEARAIAHAFLLEGLARREGGLVVALDRPRREIQGVLTALDPHVDEYEREGALRYVPDDVGEGYDRPSDGPDPSWDLNALTATFDRARQQLATRSRIRVVVETATDLLYRSPSGASLRFLRGLLDRVQGSRAAGIVVVDRAIHAREVLCDLEEVTHGRVELRRSSSTLEAGASTTWLQQPTNWFVVDGSGARATLRDRLERGSSGSRA